MVKTMVLLDDGFGMLLERKKGFHFSNPWKRRIPSHIDSRIISAAKISMTQAHQEQEQEQENVLFISLIQDTKVLRAQQDSE